ncbi:variant specific surface protein S2, putative (macronuclear) [Tetrahymena thermophila SB210]|uniref:Variant specific surface protein S2, putative n=1 Tax=Tetrahymena thermophila (strain SB210) TaxID=312017 RepID=Q234P6_TETTS|nr:variant specific surface protein S2, putative [Tetrahymena thermophila SB210]EAR91957.3 variant specific surface protein S2, putative [Tetrahymena thermophila SB210]|eukprot:XP_001012202.3 variant specific surface protein S2, putative [Tetrahymena thermophila SB210]
MVVQNFKEQISISRNKIFSQCRLFEQKSSLIYSYDVSVLSYECFICEIQAGKYFEIHKKQCYQCPDNCYYCNNNYECLSCMPNFSMVNNLCSSSELISQKRQDQIKPDCIYCDCKKFNQNNECLQCRQYCEQLKEQTVEDERQIQQQKISNPFIKRFLPQMSVQCTESNIGCSKCVQQYITRFLLQNQRNLQFPILCSECFSSYYFKSQTSQCIPCPDGCYSCTSSGCVQCQEGFFLATDVCQQCGQNCNCDQTSSCKSCQEGYFLQSTNEGNTCVTCNPSNYDPINLQCITCQSNCTTCKSINKCVLCDSGYYLLGISSNTNQCVLCSESGYYADSINNKCIQCDNNCSTCDSTNNCTSCNSGYFLLTISNTNSCVSCSGPGYYGDTTSKLCIKCQNNCQACDSSNSCISCINGYFLLTSSNSNQCVDCSGPGYYGDPSSQKCIQCSNYCQTCDSTNSCTSCITGYYLLSMNGINTCVTCNGLGYYKQVITQTCIKCPNNCLTCDQKGSCTQCMQFYFQNLNAQKIYDCQACNSDCYSCNGNTNKDCIQCTNSKYIDTISKICVICDTQKNYIQGNYCIKCDNSCLGCNGATNQNCLACNQGYYKDNTNSCQPCNSTTINKSQIDLLTLRCQKLIYKCQINPKSGLHENTAICENCQEQFILSNNQCVNTCEDLGDKFVFDYNKNTCVCQNTYPYLHVNNQDKIFCSQFIVNGYYCNSNNICYECNKNCLQCSDSRTCIQCNQNYFLWQNQCLEQCPNNMTETVDSSGNLKMCACEQGYFYSTQAQQCIQTLQVVSIKKKSDIYNNLIFQLNRVPMQSELQNLNLTIDQQKLVKGNDYTIESYQIQNDQVVFNVQVPKNRQISNINISSNELNFSFKVSNIILTTKTYNQSSKYTDGFSQQMNLFSQTLAPKDDSQKALLFILKNFQLFCFMSNFIQIFGALIVVKQYLPTQLQDCFIYGASFIFEKVPSSEDIPIFQINSSKIDQNEQIFQSLNLNLNIFKTCAMTHLEI